MGYYSFVAVSPQVVVCQKPPVLLDSGVNTFTALTDDLDGLLEYLASEGVDVKQVNRLDDHEPVQPEQSLLLPGETPEALLPLLTPSADPQR